MNRFKHLMAALMMVAAPAAMATDAAKDAKAPVGLYGELVYGDKSAPVEIIEYGSLTCPHCAHFASEIFPEFKKEFIDTGKVRFIFRNFVRDQYDMAASVAARCTKDANVTKKLTDILFEGQKEWATARNPYESIAAIAAKEGISKEAFGVCLTDDDLQKNLVEMKMTGVKSYKIDHVPTFIVNGMPVQGYGIEDMRKHVADAH